MKRVKSFFFTLLFFLCILFICTDFLYVESLKSFAFSNINIENMVNTKEENVKYKIKINNKILSFYSKDILKEVKLTSSQKEIINSENRSKYLNILKTMGFTEKESVDYCYPEVREIIKKIEKIVNIKSESDTLQVIKNTCKVNIKKGRVGQYLNVAAFYNNVISELNKGNSEIFISLNVEDEKKEDLKKFFIEKGSFKTNFSQSSDSRKSNIRTALAAFDGLMLEDGEILSFNATTGARTAENGYKEAKIISQGRYIEGFGGGVCQVSTTLYNACLLAGLEILEVHNHSLPVSYVEPSFDAMVSTGSSDLIIRNSSGSRVLFTTSSLNDECLVKIYGKKNKYKITRASEKVKTLKPIENEIITDVKKAKEYNIETEKMVVYPKDGLVSNGYLNYYDENGKLVKKQKIRETIYNPTRGLIIKNT